MTYCPERIAQGQSIIELPKIAQIISGNNQNEIKKISKIFKKICKKVIITKVIEAELIKLFSNTYRYVNFSIANQFYTMCDQLGVDYERLRLGSNFEKVVENVDLLFNIREKFYPNSLTEIRISGVDNERNLNREKFRDFWIKRCDHVSAGYPLERWNTYENEPDINTKDPCENLWDRMYIWFDGKVNPCDADYKSNNRSRKCDRSNSCSYRHFNKTS